jgi:hypothetical protein
VEASLFIPLVCAIGTDRVTDKSLEKKMGEVLSAQGKEMSEIKSNIAALSTQMAGSCSTSLLFSSPSDSSLENSYS